MKFTDNAIERVKSVMTENGLDGGETNLRLGVTGGGCSGVNFSMSFEDAKQASPLMDTQVIQGGVKAVIERRLEGMFNEVTIDFVETDGRSGFTFQRAGAGGGCCGGGCSR